MKAVHLSSTYTLRDPLTLLKKDDLHVVLLRGKTAERALCEQHLQEASIRLALPHRNAWASYRDPVPSWFVAIRDQGGQCCAGFALEVTHSRALPGHRILRAERFGTGLPSHLVTLGVAGLTELARRDARILRLHVEVFSRDEALRNSIESALRAEQFRPVADARRYTQTLAIDLRPDEDAILASFHGTARRHIRAASKHPVVIRPIEDVALATRLESLDQETRNRTGGSKQRRDWTKAVELSAQHPTASRLVGLFRTDVVGPEALLAFAWGCAQGDHAHYETAASTRQSDLRLPLAYALVWDLVRWAKTNGATWFDFGGAQEMLQAGDQQLAGIVEFKRYFTSTVVPVGGEWLLEPRWLRARVADVVRAGVAYVASLRYVFAH